MTVTTLSLSGFRNIESMVFSPCNGVNIIYGDDAQGKTNLIEALWLFTGAKSFRGAKDVELVAFGKQRAALQLSFAADERDQTAAITVSNSTGKKKEVLLNGVQKDSVGALMGRFPPTLPLCRRGRASGGGFWIPPSPRCDRCTTAY